MADETRHTAPHAPAPPQPPARIGRLRLIREIGRGGMGAVWLAHDEMLHRDVAVKFLSQVSADVDDPGFTHFLAGARAAAAVRHECITAVHAADLVDGVPYLVMELVDGPTLADLLARFGPLPLNAAVAAVVQVCRAVSELHRLELVHRDIKPSNVLVDAAGRCRVTDFGLACPRPGAGRAGLAGTPAYMAPESFDGTVSPRSDVYAIGVTAFELLTGQPPFAGSLAELRERHQCAPIPFELAQRRGSPPPLIEILQRALHRDARFRFRNADALLRALESQFASCVADGMRELNDCALRWRQTPGTALATPAATHAAPDEYFARLSARADEARATRSTADAAHAEAVDGKTPDPALQYALPCVKCGYDLRGLGSAAHCPECGTPRLDSLAPDRLIFADPRWFNRVYRGLTLAYLSVGIALLLLIVGPAGVMAYTMTTLGKAPTGTATAATPSNATRPASAAYGSAAGSVTRAWEVALVAVVLIGTAGTVGGVLMATSRPRDEPERGLTARRLTRFAAAIVILAVPCAGALAGNDTGQYAVILAFEASLMTCCAGLLLWLRRLARRARDRRRTRQTAWSLAFVILFASGWIATRLPLLNVGPVDARALRTSRHWYATAYFAFSTTAPSLSLLVAVSTGWRCRQMMKSIRPHLVPRAPFA